MDCMCFCACIVQCNQSFYTDGWNRAAGNLHATSDATDYHRPENQSPSGRTWPGIFSSSVRPICLSCLCILP